MKICAKNRGNDGFTLMEVAIAMAVVVVGILALFALIGGGLESSARAIADTHSAQFAKNVFSGLRAVSLQMAEDSRAGDWEIWWDRFRAGQEKLRVAVPDAWHEGGVHKHGAPQPGPLFVTGDDNVYAIAYGNVPQHDSSVTNIVNVALRYKCTVANPYDRPPNPRGGGGEVNFINVLWTNRAMVTLKIWNGELGPTRDKDALIYYSEFDNPGDL